MRKTFIYFAAICTVCSVLFSCTKEQDKLETETIEEKAEKPSGIEQGDGVYSITLTSPVTKTAFADTYEQDDHTFYNKHWTVGDKISVNGQESLALTAGDIDGDSRKATFHFEEAIPAVETYQVVYPSTAYNSSTKKVTIPAVQTFTSGNFDKDADIILGYGTDLNDITLRNAVAYLKIKLTKGDYGNFGVKEVKLTASGKMLNGDYAIADGGLTLTVPASTETESEQTITLDASAINPLLSDSETVFLLAVAPQTLSGGFTVTLTDTKDNTMDKTKSSSTELAAGSILAQPAFKFQEYKPIATADELIAFASNCAGDDGWYKVTANIDINDATDPTWPQAGTGDAEATAFKGGFDGGNEGTENGGFKISHLTSTTGAFINYLWSTGTVRNVTLDATCSISYSADVESNLYMGAIAGLSRGTITKCFNRADVSWTSTSYSAPVYFGGIVGRQVETGSITSCKNYGDVTSSALGGNSNIYMGGIVGSIERTTGSATASISYCENQGKVSRGDITNTAEGNLSAASITHVGGIIGMLYIKPASPKMTITNLVHSGKDVKGPEQNQNNGHAGQQKPVLVGGIIGGIHGDDISNTSGEVEISNSSVSNCNVYNGHWNNNTNNQDKDAGYGTSDHTGGFIGLARGAETSETIKLIGCHVNNVDVSCRRGLAGGLVSWARGSRIENSDVLSSSVRASANAIFAGGIAACAYDTNIVGCTVILTKNNTYSLRTRGSYYYTGGIVGWVRGASTISNCKAYVKLMAQSGTSGKEGVRGWIAGYCNGTLSITKCGLGGTYGETTPTITLDGDNYADYIYGSSSTNVTLGTGTNACYYWDGTL